MTSILSKYYLPKNIHKAIKTTEQLDLLCKNCSISELRGAMKNCVVPSVQALENAVKRGNTSVINELLKLGFRPNKKCFDNCHTVSSYRKMAQYVGDDINKDHNDSRKQIA